MSNILLAYNNRADAASYTAGSWVASGGVALANLGTKDLGELARSSSAAVTSTRFRVAMAASYTLRALGLINHNLSTAATVRMRAGRAVFDVDWASYTAEDRATFAGGAGGTRVTSAGLVASATTPRINHNPVSLAVLGLLGEEARTNLLLRSGDLSNAAWTSFGALTVTSGAADPAGGTAGVTLDDTDAGNFSVRYQDVAVANDSAQRTLTFFLKEGTAAESTIQIIYGGGTPLFYNAVVTWATKTVAPGASAGPTDVSIEPWYDGYYRVSVRGANNSTGNTNMRAGVYPAGTSNVAATGTCIAWGAQNELGSFATSYIPTTSAAVTRTADSITVTSSNFTGIHSATAGTLYAEFNLLAATGTRPIVNLDDNTANERIEMYVTGTTLKFRVVDGGVTQCDVTIGTVAANTFYKAAVAWSANDFTGCLSGTLAASPDTSGTLPTVDRMRVGSDQAGNYQNGHQKRTARFLTRLTNAELQLITTSGIDALGYDSGWVNALRFSFIGDTPTNWGEQYPVMFAFDAITARYGTLEINDTANTAGYVQAGRLFVGGGFQPTNNAEYGRQRGRNDLSSSVKSISGKKYSTARRRPRTVDIRLPVLTVAEANHLDEMNDFVGTTEEVFYVSDPADMEMSQRESFLCYLRELSPLEDTFDDIVSTPYRLEEKL
mgnify:CR=1 FL=1